tara:strand:+ start:838 stop:1059 length:222 start_codon:yes stop_codon:yes gene_type:complete
MKLKDQKKLKIHNCLDCGLHEKGICNWFEEPKRIPVKVINKGCKFWRDDRAQYIIEKYNGKLITRRRYAKSRW